MCSGFSVRHAYGLTYLPESEVIDAAFNALKWAVWHTQVNCIEELIHWLQERAYSPRQGTLSMYLERAQEDLYYTPLHRAPSCFTRDCKISAAI